MCDYGGNTVLHKTEAKLLSGLSLRLTREKMNKMMSKDWKQEDCLFSHSV